MDWSLGILGDVHFVANGPAIAAAVDGHRRKWERHDHNPNGRNKKSFHEAVTRYILCSSLWKSRPPEGDFVSK